jgi:hypothetical protein
MAADVATQIEQESRSRLISKSDVVRERLSKPACARQKAGTMREMIGDLVGQAKGLPSDLSKQKKEYLMERIHSKKSPRR